MRIVGREDGFVVLGFRDSPEEIVLPVSGEHSSFLAHGFINAYLEAVREESFERFGRVVDLLAGPARAVAPHLDLPAESFDGHELWSLFVESAIREGFTDGVVEVLKRTHFGGFPESSVPLLATLMEHLLIQDRPEDLLILMQRLYGDEPSIDLNSLSLQAIRGLARQRELVFAEDVARLGVAGAEGASRSEALISLAYVLLIRGKTEEARTIIGGVEIPSPEESAFPFYALVEATLLSWEGRQAEAADLIAQASVLSPVDGAASPEILYFVVESYLAENRPEAALEAFRELAIFYPKNPGVAELREKHRAHFNLEQKTP